jgi:hypothetical protein
VLSVEIDVETPLLRVEMPDDSDEETPVLSVEIEVETPVLKFDRPEDSDEETPVLKVERPEESEEETPVLRVDSDVETPLLRVERPPPRVEIWLETPLLRVERPDDSDEETPVLSVEIDVETPLLRVERPEEIDDDSVLATPVIAKPCSWTVWPMVESELDMVDRLLFSVPPALLCTTPVAVEKPVVLITCARARCGAASITSPRATAAPRLITDALT